MAQKSNGEGTKIAQAAKELNVTSVTIRRYLSEFEIETTSDENGVKVLPSNSMDELQEIRRLKEEGLTNPQVQEMLEEKRVNKPTASKKPIKAKSSTSKAIRAVSADEDEDEESLDETPPTKRPVRSTAPAKGRKVAAAAEEEEEPVIELEAEEESSEAEAEPESEAGTDLSAPLRSKHSLTCQTCGKVFEHMNPRLRDCLDCYRTKRKERRRGGNERHKNVIQHPLAQQAVTKSSQQSPTVVASASPERERATVNVSRPVRNYRKAIEETRQITGNLKRRLERPDLHEGERRWLEQIYAYQLILHQGWRHLSDYKSAGQQQNRGEQSSTNDSTTALLD